MLKNKILLNVIFGLSLFGTSNVLAKGGLEGFKIGTQANLNGLQRVKQELVAPPFSPKHNQIAKEGPKIVEIKMSIIEKEIEKVNCNTYYFW